MTPNNNTGFSREDIARLSFLNWEKDGRPHGRETHYWLEAEAQLKATWHLLPASQPQPQPVVKTPAAKSKSLGGRKSAQARA